MKRQCTLFATLDELEERFSTITNSHRTINPTGIVPVDPDLDFDASAQTRSLSGERRFGLNSSAVHFGVASRDFLLEIAS